MKDFAKSIVCNTKTGNSNKAEIIEKKKKEGATLKVDNGQKLEFSDGSTYVKTSFSDDYREAHNYTGNTKAGNTDVVKAGNKKVGNGLDQQEAREFQQSLKPIKSLIEDAGAAAYASPKEAIANLQRAKQEIEKAIQWLK